ncbi:MAG: hypothetical protein LBE91_20105, partial [Tannerella sp.]|nr:hypothetical protein [Tannerella sp.]
MVKKIIILIFIFTGIASVNAEDADFYTQKSALSEGKWVKIRIRETGFYKLTYAELRKMGFSDPAKVSVHGYGGFPMEEDFSKALYFDDAPSVPVWRGNDFLLFYGKGVVKWTYNNGNKSFIHENNSYSTYGYYFVTDATETDEVAQMQPYTGNTDIEVNTYDDYMLHETERVSVTVPGRPNSGRELFGESFDQRTSQDFTFAIPGITGDDGLITYRFIGKLKTSSGTVSMRVNDALLNESNIPVDTYEYTAALDVNPRVAWTGEKSENTTVNIGFSLGQQPAYLDYIRVQMKRTLQPYGAVTFFRSVESLQKNTKFKIGNTANLLVFNVTEGKPMQQVAATADGSGQTFSMAADPVLQEFAVVDVSKEIPAPETVGEVPNQNLHALPQT